VSASTTERPRVARVYTAARRHPWVLGKLGDWTIWLGPYSPAQLLVMGGGALLLIKTWAWWSWLGPVPVVLWLVAIWAVRGATIGGRSPIAAAVGWIALLARHPAGRIAGRPARVRRATTLAGAFVIEPAPARTPAAAAGLAAQGRPARSARSSRRRPASPAAVVRPVPVSGLEQLLRDAPAREMAGRS
jgi:hypothetical protein